MAPQPPRLRLALTLPGGVSLGSYYGGALAALITAVQHSGGAVVVDAIGAASAGSVTALLAARSLLRGADPVALMRGAWVDGASINDLRERSPASPLSAGALRAMARRLLGDGGAADGDRRQDDPIRLSFALASLGGLGYRIRSLEQSDTPEGVLANTYVDWFTTTVDGTTADYVALAEPALASAANPLGFPPLQLQRTEQELADYRRNGIEWVPDSGTFWYTDGGTVENEPLGRTIDLVQDLEAATPELPGERRYLLITPQPPVASQGGRWWEAEPPPTWTETLVRSFKILTTQTTYDDLRRMEKTNSHIRWTLDLVTELRQAFADLADETKADVDAHLRPALERVLATIAGDKATLAGKDASPPATPDDFGALLETALRSATGLRGKQTVRLDVVSPVADLDDPASNPPERQLAGEFLNSFGGFLGLELRQSDFALGYRNMQYRVERLEAFQGTPALAEVARVYETLGWDGVRHGGAGLGSLQRRAKWDLAKLGGHISRVVVGDLVTTRRRRSPATPPAPPAPPGTAPATSAGR